MIESWDRFKVSWWKLWMKTLAMEIGNLNLLVKISLKFLEKDDFKSLT